HLLDRLALREGRLKSAELVIERRHLGSFHLEEPRVLAVLPVHLHDESAELAEEHLTGAPETADPAAHGDALAGAGVGRRGFGLLLLFRLLLFRLLLYLWGLRLRFFLWRWRRRLQAGRRR